MMSEFNPPQEMYTRDEFSRSIEDGERFKALETLKEVGLLIPVSQLDTFHGRAGDGSPWRVRPDFSNGGNNSGNNNVYDRSTLYTGGSQDAKDFAEIRARRSHGKKPAAEVYQIGVNDSDATVIDVSFRFKLDELSHEMRQKYHKALKTLLIPPTEGSPLSFEASEEDIPSITKLIDQQKKFLLTEEDITKIAEDLAVDKATVRHLASARNSYSLMAYSPTTLADLFTYNNGDSATLHLNAEGRFNSYSSKDPTKDMPFSLEYIARFFRQAHIVGTKDIMNSVTLGRQVHTVAFFDLEKVNTTEAMKSSRQNTWDHLGKIASFLKDFALLESQPKNKVMALLQDAHVKPKRLVEEVKSIEGYQAIFDADAGVWEGFTIEEHTETVLRNFDETYADRLPIEFLAPMRLAILAHDLGKPKALKNGGKQSQDKYNVEVARDLFSKLGIEPMSKLENALIVIIVGSGLLAKREKIGRNISDQESALAGENLNKLIQMLLFNEYDPAANESNQPVIKQFVAMCKMLLACDGGAYTTMATTRRPTGTYRNAGSFDASFYNPPSPFGRSTRLKKRS